MKCPKCGSEMTIINTAELKTLWQCEECSFMQIEAEPTTAEKLLWLVENVKGVCIFDCDLGHLGIRMDLPRNKFRTFTTNDEVKNRDMLIDKAYKWAKEAYNGKKQ